MAQRNEEPPAVGLVPARRRPFDYFHCLPLERQRDVCGRLKSAYGRTGFPEDCGQEACFQLLKYNYNLELAPPPTIQPTPAWYDGVENALVRFARSRNFKASVISKVLRAHKGSALPGQNSSETDVEELGELDSEIERVMERMHWSVVVLKLRNLFLEQPDVDISVIKVLDQLHENAQRFDRWVNDASDKSRLEDITRGESFQINHEPLLAALVARYPDDEWTLEKLRLSIAKLCRNWKQIANQLAQEGQPIFEEPSSLSRRQNRK